MFGSVVGFKVYYLSTKTGFSNPWNSYTTQVYQHLSNPVINPSTTSTTNGDVTVSITYPNDSTINEYKIGILRDFNFLKLFLIWLGLLSSVVKTIK